MSSQARLVLEKQLADVEEVISMAQGKSEGGRGKKLPEVLRRAMIVMICAVWETYIEQLILEGVRGIVEHTEDIDGLPRKLRKYANRAIAKAEPEESSGILWKEQVLQDSVAELTGKHFNSPAVTRIEAAMKDYLGLEDPFSHCHWQAYPVDSVKWDLNDLMKMRHEIAHTGVLAAGRDKLYTAGVRSWIDWMGRLADCLENFTKRSLPS